MLWEIVLDCQPFATWTDPNPNIGSRLARYDGIPLHPVYGRPYHSGAWRLGSVRRPTFLIPSVSKELEALLLRALGLELDAGGKIEMLRKDTSRPADSEETAKVPRERIRVLRDPGYFGDLGGEKNITITTRAYYPLLQPNDLFACSLILWEIVLNCHPLLNHWAGFDSVMIGPELEEKMSHAFGLRGVFLEQLSMVKKPSMVDRDRGITPAMEDLLLKAIGLQQLADGKIDLDEGFKSFRPLKNELCRQMKDGHVTGR
jgi:hypothetical protein